MYVCMYILKYCTSIYLVPLLQRQKERCQLCMEVIQTARKEQDVEREKSMRELLALEALEEAKEKKLKASKKSRANKRKSDPEPTGGKKGD